MNLPEAFLARMKKQLEQNMMHLSHLMMRILLMDFA